MPEARTNWQDVTQSNADKLNSFIGKNMTGFNGLDTMSMDHILNGSATLDRKAFEIFDNGSTLQQFASNTIEFGGQSNISSPIKNA